MLGEATVPGVLWRCLCVRYSCALALSCVWQGARVLTLHATCTQVLAFAPMGVCLCAGRFWLACASDSSMTLLVLFVWVAVCPGGARGAHGAANMPPRPMTSSGRSPRLSSRPSQPRCGSARLFTCLLSGESLSRLDLALVV